MPASGPAFVSPLHPVQTFFFAFQQNETKALGEHFIRDNGSVVVVVDFFDGEGGDFGKEDAAEGVGEGDVEADEREGGFEGVVAVELDFEVLDAVRILDAEMEKGRCTFRNLTKDHLLSSRG